MDDSCTSVRSRLSGYLERSLPQPEREAVSRHLAGCPACDQALAETRDLVAALGHLDRVDLPEGFGQRFSARLHAEAAARPAVRAAGRAAARPWWAGWFTFGTWPARALAGVAAGLLLFLAFHAAGPDAARQVATGIQPAGPQAQAVALKPDVGLGKDVMVSIWFDASQDVDGVRFTLTLPDGVRMVQDRNLIPLHVRGVAKGEWTVTASAEKGGAYKERSIGLRVDGV
jgi:anti-sigma factor RsiW